jgi:2-polyprenyl-3-methyl-5-hydroxy-6-metoxy-1,4-benzoquinol methylase
MFRHFKNLIASSYMHAKNPYYQMLTSQLLKNNMFKEKSRFEIFSNIDDEYWYWLHTHGYRKNPVLQTILPSTPNEDVQLMFTGNKGDHVMREGYSAYLLFKNLYTNHIGPINQCSNILDFGCGWGRIIRYFMKDIDESKLHGCDPVEKMIEICKQQNQWCNFTKINTRPPTPYQDNTFDLIYSFSVFSHLSEEMSDLQLAELTRILKPGGMLILTTRSRDFIEYCAQLRKRKDLESMNEGPKSSAAAFMDTKQSLADYDSGKFCFSQLVHEGEWSYWGDTAISKPYVLNHWTKSLNYVDYVDDQKYITQNAIVMTKPKN